MARGTGREAALRLISVLRVCEGGEVVMRRARVDCCKHNHNSTLPQAAERRRKKRGFLAWSVRRG